MRIALVGQKGGVGKSTVAVCLAAHALERGARVLLVDADPQGTVRTWGDVASEQGRAMPTVVAHGATMHRPDQLPRLAKGFDVVLVDTPPRAGDVQRSALMFADVVLLPCGPSAPDAWALASTLELVREAATLRPELAAYVLLTRVQRGTELGRTARTVLEESGFPVLATELGHRVAYQEALAAGLGVTTYAPTSDAAHEVRRLYTEVMANGKTARTAPKASHAS